MAKGKSGDGKDGETTFEKDLDRLEEIVKTLEDGDLPLDEAIALYEEGVALSKRCGKRLDLAEAKIEKIMAKDGKVEKEDYRE